jgi:hypothetical protein
MDVLHYCFFDQMEQLSLFKPSQIFEAQYKLQGLLPQTYLDFYNQCEVEVPLKFREYTLGNSDHNLKQHANWLLERNGIQDFLKTNDFVFQYKYDFGFWYFQLDGQEDPLVMCWMVGCIEPFEISGLSDYLD